MSTKQIKTFGKFCGVNKLYRLESGNCLIQISNAVVMSWPGIMLHILYIQFTKTLFFHFIAVIDCFLSPNPKQ